MHTPNYSNKDMEYFPLKLRAVRCVFPSLCVAVTKVVGCTKRQTLVSGIPAGDLKKQLFLTALISPVFMAKLLPLPNLLGR